MRTIRFLRVPLLVVSLALLGAAGTIGATEAMRRTSIAPYATNRHNANVGFLDNYITVRGSGTTDLDCWVYDSDGDLVDADTGPTDDCYLETPGIGQHKLVVKNLGAYANSYEALRRE